MAKRQLIAALFSISVVGCASQAQHLRSQPIMYMDITGDSGRVLEITLPPIEEQASTPATTTTNPPTAVNDRYRPVAIVSLDRDAKLPVTFGDANAGHPTNSITAGKTSTAPGSSESVSKLVIRCVRTPEFYNKDTTSTRAQCLYEALDYQDLLNLPVRNKDERNRIIDVLASISERNCRTFRDRVFANKAALDATKNTGKDIATALAAGTVKAAAGFSAGVGIFNLVGGSAITNVNQVIFSDKTFDVISAAIEAERAKAKATLNLGRRQKLQDYSYQSALDDFQNYDLACSIENALDHLGSLAEDDKKAQTATLNATRGSELDELHRELDNTRAQRQADQDLLKQAQKKLLDSKDEKERAALDTQIKDLRDQVTASTNALRALQLSIHAATTTPETPQPQAPVAPQTPPMTNPTTTPPTAGKTPAPIAPVPNSQ